MPAVVLSRHELAEGTWQRLLHEHPGARVLVEHTADVPQDAGEALAARSAIYFGGPELTTERVRFQCNELACSLALCRALRTLDAAAPLDAVSIPARDALAYFPLRARRAGLAFADVSFTLRGEPLEAPTTLDRPAAIADHMRRWSACELGQAGSGPETTARGVTGPGTTAARAVSEAGAPGVSVVVPVYNLHQYLPDVLACLRAQTRAPDEILIADDGSTDPATVKALDRIRQNAVRVLRLPHRGLAATRNAAIREARTDWVLTLDADDLIEPEFIERSLAALRADPSLSMVTSLVSCFDATPDRPSGGWCPLGFDRDMLAVFNFASCATALLRREDVLSVGGYDETMPAYEDWELYAALAERGLRSCVIPEFLIHVRVRPDSMLRTLKRATHERLRARIVAKHPALVRHPDRALRLLQGEYVPWHTLDTPHAGTGLNAGEAVFPPDAEALARVIVRRELRYRLADRVNTALKRFGVHRVVKSLFDR